MRISPDLWKCNRTRTRLRSCKLCEIILIRTMCVSAKRTFAVNTKLTVSAHTANSIGKLIVLHKQCDVSHYRFFLSLVFLKRRQTQNEERKRSCHFSFSCLQPTHFYAVIFCLVKCSLFAMQIFLFLPFSGWRNNMTIYTSSYKGWRRSPVSLIHILPIFSVGEKIIMNEKVCSKVFYQHSLDVARGGFPFYVLHFASCLSRAKTLSIFRYDWFIGSDRINVSMKMHSIQMMHSKLSLLTFTETSVTKPSHIPRIECQSYIIFFQEMR